MSNWSWFTKPKYLCLIDLGPVTITHVKEQKDSGEKRGKQILCGHDDHAGYIYKFMQWCRFQ
jgi:hypothetical protein